MPQVARIFFSLYGEHSAEPRVMTMGIVVWRFEKCFATATECHPVLSSGKPIVTACGCRSVAVENGTITPNSHKRCAFKGPRAQRQPLLIFRSVLAKRIQGEGGRRRNASGNHQQTFLNNKSQSEPLRRAQLPAFIISEGIARKNIESVTSHREITLRTAPLCLSGVSGECQPSTPCAFTIARTSPSTARNSRQAIDCPSQTYFERNNWENRQKNVSWSKEAMPHWNSREQRPSPYSTHTIRWNNREQFQ